jgi:membrane dipeptidase
MVRVFDLHCDTPHNIMKGTFKHIIPEKLYAQGYLGAVFAHFVPPRSRYPFVDAVRMLSATIAYVRKKKRLHIVRSYNEIRHDRVNIILGVEGGHIFDNTIKQVEVLYDLGVRIFTVTWNNSNKLAYSALEADKKGLTARGKKYMKEMAGYNIVIDLSHASTRTVLDICENTRHQVIASHSCVRAFRQKFLRNIDDRALAAIVAREGVVGINFSRYHLGGHSVVEHMNYIREKHGIEHAAIGSDFDGINDPVIKSPAGLKKLGEDLGKQGFFKKAIHSIYSQNFLRVFKKAGK